MKWYEIHDNFVLLCRYLTEREQDPYDLDELKAVIREPWKWQREFNEGRRWSASRDCA